VTISFTQDIVEVESRPARENLPLEDAASNPDQDVPENPAVREDPAPPSNTTDIESGGDTSSQIIEQQNTSPDLPEENAEDSFTGGREDNPSTEDVLEPTDPVETGEDANQATPGRRFVETTPSDDPGPEYNDNQASEETNNSIELGDIGNLFNNNTDDPADVANTTDPAVSKENPYGFSGEIKNLRIVFSTEPAFDADIPAGVLAFRIDVNQDGTVLYKGIDFKASSLVFSTISSEKLVGPMRAAISQWRLTPHNGAQALSGIGYIRITK
jgi:hypothetical protein